MSHAIAIRDLVHRLTLILILFNLWSLLNYISGSCPRHGIVGVEHGVLLQVHGFVTRFVYTTGPSLLIVLTARVLVPEPIHSHACLLQSHKQSF